MIKTKARYSVALSWAFVLSLLGGCARRSPVDLPQPIASVQTIGSHRTLALPILNSTPPPLPALPPDNLAQKQILTAAQNAAAQWAARLVGTNGAVGLGLVVAEPRAAKNISDEAQKFGVGCARWLHLRAAGQGELSATPLWGQVDDARRQLKKATRQFAPADLPVVAQSGASHVAIGEWKENHGRATLTYQLWRAHPSTNTGETFSISGNRAQIVAQLPVLAARLGRATGANAHEKIEKIYATPEDLEFLGRVPWTSDQPLDAPTSLRLTKLAAREPLAALLMLRDGQCSNQAQKQVVAQLLKRASHNTLVLGEIGWLQANQFAYNVENGALLEAAQKKYPNNFLVSCASALQFRALRNRQEERKWLDTAVRSAPRNGLMWLQLAKSLNDQAQELRQRRAASQMNSREWKYLHAIYPNWRNAALESTRLNANNAQAWREVAVAAAFGSDRNLADAAFWKAVRLAPHDARILLWGMEMFAPKWHSDRQKLLWVSNRIEADSEALDVAYSDALLVLQEAGLNGEMQAMRDRVTAHYDKALVKNPQDAGAHLRLAYLARDFYDDEQFSAAAREFEAYLKARPEDNSARLEYGRLLHYKMRLYRKAERHYQEVLQRDSDNSGALCALADLTYYAYRDAYAAEKMYRHAIAIDNSMWAHVELARLLLDQSQRAAARRQTSFAVSAGLTAGDNPIFGRLKTPIETFQAEDYRSWQY